MSDTGAGARPGDNRRTPRVERPLVVWYRAASDVTWRSSPVNDVSSGGARFLSERAFGVGATLDLQLQLPEPLSVRARVAWQEPSSAGMIELGVIFEAGDVETKRRLEDAVVRFLRRPKA